MKITATVQIGNTDDKLSQREWSDFVDKVGAVVNRYASQVHFSGGSGWRDPWQNACIVCEIGDHLKQALVGDLTEVRQQYRQDSVAITFGNTDFV